LTLATPLWLGMSHVDYKDVPVAAGVTLVTAGLVLSLVPESGRKATLVGALLAGSGGAIALATRAGALALIVAVAGGTAATAVGWRIGSRRPFAISPVLIASCSTLVCALAFTWATNPIARIDMLQWLEDAAEYARAFEWELPPMRVAGRDVLGNDLPWWYLPAWLAAQLPLLTLVAVVGGLVVLVVGVVRRRGLVHGLSTIALVPIVLQAIVLPVALLLGGAVIYDGLRHLLFMLPALIAIPAVALAVLDHRASEHRSRLSVVLPLGAIVIVAASLWASIRWAPYAYAFVNPVAGANKNGRSWDLDYWGVSAKEGVERLRELGYSPIYVEPEATVGTPYGAAEGASVGGPHAGLYVFLRWYRAADYGCTVLFTIERDGHVLGEGARCPTGTGRG
jgi:MFS family permease